MSVVLSIVMPVYNEGESIYKNICRVVDVMKINNISYEIVLVDDGSIDQSWPEITRAALSLPGVKGLRLSRNFGKENALCAGLDSITGDICLCMDSDMQHPPEYIPKMYAMSVEEGYEVVDGIKSTRGKESTWYSLCAQLFYTLLHKTSGIDLNDASDFRLLGRKALAAWKSMPERQTFFRGMSTWIGFRRTQVLFDVADRESGNTKWSLIALIRLALQAVTSFTAAPLYLSAFLGLGLLIAFAFMLIHTLIMKLLGFAADGFTTVIALQLVIGGSLMMSVGIIGIYIEKIYEEVKQRPRYLVQEITSGVRS